MATAIRRQKTNIHYYTKTKETILWKTCKNETTAPVRAAFLNQWLVQLLIIKMCVIHVVLTF